LIEQGFNVPPNTL